MGRTTATNTEVEVLLPGSAGGPALPEHVNKPWDRMNKPGDRSHTPNRCRVKLVPAQLGEEPECPRVGC